MAAAKRGAKGVVHENDEGARDARVIHALEEGRTVAAIVIAEKIPLRIVLALRETWLIGHAADLKGVNFKCVECGSPSNPSYARCDRCAPYTKTLTEAQRAILAGTPLPEPNACKCSGCSNVIDTNAADHVCVRCLQRVGVVVRDGLAHVVVSGVVLHSLSKEETRVLTSQLAMGIVGAPQIVPNFTQPVPAGASASTPLVPGQVTPGAGPFPPTAFPPVQPPDDGKDGDPMPAVSAIRKMQEDARLRIEEIDRQFDARRRQVEED